MNLKILFLVLQLIGIRYPQPADNAGLNLIINPRGTNIAERFLPPQGFVRKPCDSSSFAHWLRHFRLKPDGSAVYYYNGAEKPKKVHEAVLDVDVGDKDLQQCADAVIRLRAEYLYQRKDFEKIHFNFTSGFNAQFSKWIEGYRIIVKGNDVKWVKSAAKDASRKSFTKYLETVFSYAGTLSLAKELKPVNLSDVQPGDVFIQGGSPGHAVIVMDVAENASGEKIFMLAQSYMPAQSIHVLKNPNSVLLSPWYDPRTLNKIFTPEWAFEKTDLKRFG